MPGRDSSRICWVYCFLASFTREPRVCCGCGDRGLAWSICMTSRARRSEASVSGPRLRGGIRSIDEFPKTVYETYEDEDDQGLSEPLGQCAMGGFDLAARYGGFVGISPEGAIAWRCTRHPNGIIVRGWRFVGREMLVGRHVYGGIMVRVVVMVLRLKGVGWWGRWCIVGGLLQSVVAKT
jgi:hypothetical protein